MSRHDFPLALLSICMVQCHAASPPATAGATDSVDASAAIDAVVLDTTPRADTTLPRAFADLANTADLTNTTDATDAGMQPLISTDIDAWCKPWVKWSCTRALGCGCGLPDGQALTQANCEAPMFALCYDDMKKIGQMMEAGWVALHTGQIAACLDELAAAVPACVIAGRQMFGSVGCLKMLVQPLWANGKCSMANQYCPDLTGCDGKKCGIKTQPGGAACAYDGACTSMRCDQFDTHKCSALLSAGEACEKRDICPAMAPCQAGTCTPPKVQGAPCAQTGECGLMLTCAGGKCAPAVGACTVAGAGCAAGAWCIGPGVLKCRPQLCKKVSDLF